MHTKESLIIAAAIRAALADPNTTKTTIAEQIGVSPGMLYQWSTGRRPVSPEKAAAAAKVLGIDDPASISPGYAEATGGSVGANA